LIRGHRGGLRLDDATAGQEHFSGYSCRTFGDDTVKLELGEE